MNATGTILRLTAISMCLNWADIAQADTPPMPPRKSIDSQVCRVGSAGLEVVQLLGSSNITLEELNGKVRRVSITGSLVKQLSEPLPLAILRLSINGLVEEKYPPSLVFLDLKDTEESSLDLESGDSKLQEVTGVIQSVIMQLGHSNRRAATGISSQYERRHFSDCTELIAK